MFAREHAAGGEDLLQSVLKSLRFAYFSEILAEQRALFRKVVPDCLAESETVL